MSVFIGSSSELLSKIKNCFYSKSLGGGGVQSLSHIRHFVTPWTAAL